MASTRAAEVAEILWELKRAGKVATYTVIARRAGFSPGANGRMMATALRSVRQDWPHLEWWRAVEDDGLFPEDSEQARKLRKSGFELEPADETSGVIAIKEFEQHLMTWDEESTELGR